MATGSVVMRMGEVRKATAMPIRLNMDAADAGPSPVRPHVSGWGGGPDARARGDAPSEVASARSFSGNQTADI